MKIFPLLFCLVLFLASDVFAQATQSSNCPTLDVSGGGVVEPGEPMIFTVSVENYDLSRLTFKWTVSGGEILEGQETRTIKVATKKYSSIYITATVEVKGLPEGCTITDSETGSVPYCPSPRLFDEFGSLSYGDIRERIPNLFVELGENPGAQGYIINYGTDREIARRERQIRDAITFLKLDAPRITLVNGGANPRGKGIWTKVWIVQPGAENPTPDM